MARESRADLLAKIQHLEDTVTELSQQNRERQGALNYSQVRVNELTGDVASLEARLAEQETQALTTMAAQTGRHFQVLRLLQAVVDGDLELKDIYGLLTAIAMENTGVLLIAAQRSGIQTGPTGLEKQILDELDAGKKIQAIMTYRDSTGAGLKQAKDFVEALQARYRG